MRPDLKAWTCGQCQRTILVPPADDPGYSDTILRVREHRFGHLTETLMHGSDDDLWSLCADDDPTGRTIVSLGNINAAMEHLQDVDPTPPDPVDSDDLAPVLSGIEGLLRDDLPRARRLWYPINEDGGFNR